MKKTKFSRKTHRKRKTKKKWLIASMITPKKIIFLFAALLAITGVAFWWAYSTLLPETQDKNITKNRYDKNFFAKLRATLENPETLMEPPLPNAPQKEKEEYFEKVVLLAAPSDYLTIRGCAIHPFILRARENSLIIIRNSDDEDHYLTFDSAHRYLIPAKGAKQIVASFGNGTGIYGYACDENEKISGILLITEL